MNPIQLTNTTGNLPSSRISDATVAGKSLLTAATAAAQRSLLGITDTGSITVPYAYRAYFSPSQSTTPDIVDLVGPLHIQGVQAAGDNAASIEFELRKLVGSVYVGQGRGIYQALNRAIFALTQADYDQGIQVAYWVTPIDATKFASVRLLVQDTAENTADPVVTTPAINHSTPVFAESVPFSAGASNEGYLTVPLTSAYPAGVGIVFWCFPELGNPAGYWMDFRDAVNGANGYFLGDATAKCAVTVRDASNNAANYNALTVDAAYRFVVNVGALEANSTLTFLNRWSLNERATGRKLSKIAVYNRPLTDAERDNISQRPPDSDLLGYYSLSPAPSAGQTTVPDTSGNNRTATVGGF